MALIRVAGTPAGDFNTATRILNETASTSVNKTVTADGENIFIVQLSSGEARNFMSFTTTGTVIYGSGAQAQNIYAIVRCSSGDAVVMSFDHVVNQDGSFSVIKIA